MIQLIKELGFPIALSVALLYIIKTIFTQYIDAIFDEINDLKGMTIKLIDANNKLRAKLVECTSDLKTIIEFTKGVQK